MYTNAVMIKGMSIIVVLIWHFCVSICGEIQDALEYPLTTTYLPERKLHPAGKELKLHCWDHNKRSSPHHKINNYKWYYKRCRKSANMKSCWDHISDGPWKSLCGDNSQNACNSTLVLPAPSEADTGLYKCSVSHMNRTSKYSSIYILELEIWDLKSSPPEFLPKLPKNITVLEGSPAVFQCRVHSKLPHMFFWFRQLGYTACNATTSLKYLRLLDETFEAMQSSGERALSEEIHISKLILPKTTEKDTGYYVCVAINVAGFSIQGSQLTVLKNPVAAQTVAVGVTSTSLLLLFLIPAVMVLALLGMWACCPCSPCYFTTSRHKYTSVNTPTFVCCAQKNDSRYDINKVIF